MFQASDDRGMIVLLTVGGIGLVLLLSTFAFLADKLATKNHNADDQEGIMEDDYEEEYSGHIDTIDNERAIFIIEERNKLSCLERINDSNPFEETEKIVTTRKEEEIKSKKNDQLAETINLFQLRLLQVWSYSTSPIYFEIYVLLSRDCEKRNLIFMYEMK